MTDAAKFSYVPGALRTGQRAEHQGVVFSLQAFSGIHVGIDNLNVSKRLAQLIDTGLEGASLKDGDMLSAVKKLFSPRRMAGSELPRLKDTLANVRSRLRRSVRRISLGTTVLVLQLTVVDRVTKRLSLVPSGLYSGCAGPWYLLCLICGGVEFRRSAILPWIFTVDDWIRGQQVRVWRRGRQ